MDDDEGEEKSLANGKECFMREPLGRVTAEDGAGVCNDATTEFID